MKIHAISDLHGQLPQVERCDLLLVAGDLCPDFNHVVGQRRWLREIYAPWCAKQPAHYIHETWGNHDFIGQSEYADDVLPWTVHVDELVTVTCDDETVSVWFSPWSNQFYDWAFMREPYDLKQMYNAIPDGVDIIVSHQPPYGYGDVGICPNDDGDMHVGSRELLETIHRVKPRAVVCGHIHGGHGVYDAGGVPIYNVSVVDEEYRLVHGSTEIVLR
jgi:hypothetical protein